MVNYMKMIIGPDWDERYLEIKQEGRVGILMSGGIDSYVLYHLLDNPMVFNIKRADGFDTADRVRDLIDRPNGVIEVDEQSTEHEWRVKNTSEHIIEEYGLDQLYNASNMIPPIHLFPEFAEGYASRPFRYGNPKVKAPFAFMYKYHIINLAYRLNLDLDKTESCIASTAGGCGMCWHCKERAWGFEHGKPVNAY